MPQSPTYGNTHRLKSFPLHKGICGNSYMGIPTDFHSHGNPIGQAIIPSISAFKSFKIEIT